MLHKKIDVFISHSNKDSKLADAMCHYLEEREIRCWIAPRDTNKKVGNDYAESIIEGIQSSKIMVVVFSKNANQSHFVKNEVERAFHYKLIIMPFKTDGTIPSGKLELFLSSIHWLDAVNGKAEDYFDELYKNCASILGKPIVTLTKVEEFFFLNKSNAKTTEKKNILKKNLKYIVLLFLVAIGTSIYYFLRTPPNPNSKFSKILPNDTTPLIKKDTNENISAGKLPQKETLDTKKIGTNIISQKDDGQNWCVDDEKSAKLNKWVFSDNDFKVKLVVSKEYKSVMCFYDGMCIVEYNNEEGAINKAGIEVIPIKYDVLNTFENGIAIFKLGNKTGIVNKAGSEIYANNFELVGQGFNEGLTPIKSKNHYGCANSKLEIIIPFDYQEMDYFHDGIVAVKLNGKWGFIDKSNKFVIPNIYDKFNHSAGNGKFSVSLSGETFFINSKGEKVK